MSLNKYIVKLCFVVLCCMVLAACKTREIKVYETLQLPATANIYTQYNIWYENPEEISSLNYQKGKILPMGTEVEIINAEPDEIVFKDKGSGKEFTINFERRWEMIPIEKYITRLFGPKNLNQLSEGVDPISLHNIKLGKVEKGMTRDDVLKAYGYPAAYRTISLKEDTWIYWNAPLHSKRVIFYKDKVSTVFTLK